MKMTKYVEAHLAELAELVEKSRPDLLEDAVHTALAGHAEGEGPRIPAADNGQELYFRNRELLVRFAAMSLHSQAQFLRSVRKAMQQENVEVARINVSWGDKVRRTIDIKIDRSNDTECLIFNLL